MQWPVAEEAGEASSVAHTTEADLVSKFLEIRWEILNLVHEKDEATREVVWLKLQVDALQTNPLCFTRRDQRCSGKGCRG